MAETAMLNVRMDRDVRGRGNAALQALGVTPTQLVRQLWTKLAQDPKTAQRQVAAVMAPERTPERQAQVNRRIEALERGDRLFENFAQSLGLDPATYTPMEDDWDALADARYELLEEKYGR